MPSIPLNRVVALTTGILILTQSAQSAEIPTGAKVAFRNSNVQVKSAPASPATVDTSKNSQAELDDISEQKQSLESELRYAQSKLDAARKKLLISTAAKNNEGIEVANRDIKDWEARVKNCQTQLQQADASMQTAINQMQGPDGGSDLLLPGDNVEVYVAEDSSFNGKYPVRRGGYIIMPQVGRIYIAGSEIDGAESSIRKALEASQLQRAHVTVEKLEGTDIEAGPVIYLTGEFRTPRPYHIPAGTAPTVVSVILSSGGLSEKADLRHVKIMRVAGGKGVTEEVDVQRILDGSGGTGLSSDLRLNDGDVVLVPQNQASVVYLTGNVKKQGIQPIGVNSKLSCYAAILNAGGFARFANQSRVYILREMPDGTKTRIPVNVSDIQKGKQADIPLVGNDIVVVPEKFFSL